MDSIRIHEIGSTNDPFKGGNAIGSVKARGKYTWVESSHRVVGSLSPDSHEYVGSCVSGRGYAVGLVFIVSVFALIFFRVTWLQIFHGGVYAAIAEQNRTRHLPIVAERGVIFDRHGVALVRNSPRYALHIFPHDIPRDAAERQIIIDRIVGILGVDELELSERFDALLGSFERDVLLYERLTQQEAIALSVASVDVPALRVETGIRRTYDVFDHPVDSLSHIIGYEGKISEEELIVDSDHYSSTDYVGKQGVEAEFEHVLRGVKGDRVIEVSSQGAQLSVLSEALPVHGSDVTLSIDVEMQRFVEEALQHQMELSHTSRGVVVVQAVESGEILSMVSLPSFSNEDFARGITQDEFNVLLEDKDKPLINRAVSGLYPSGSTIKPVMALAALVEGVIDERTTFVSTGGISVGPWFFPDWRAGGHGVTDVRWAIADSVNTFFYLIGGGDGQHAGLGVDRIYRWLREFGFGEKTGIELSLEQVGLVPHPDWKELRKGEQWYIGDTYNLSIGQGDLLVTPLQLTNAIATIANGGRLMKPRIVHAIDGILVDSGVVRELDGSDAQYNVVKAGMRDAVLVGSARYLSDALISVAGKTGTAQWSSVADPHAWFVGFAPYERPEIAVTVLIEEGAEGSRVSVPVAKEIFNWWARHTYVLSP